MAEMKLDGGVAGERRRMLVPVLLALIVLAAAGGWFAKSVLKPSVTGSVHHVEVFPVHVKYQRGSGTLVGADQTEDALYVIADVELDDRSKVPLFLKSIQAKFTAEDGTEVEGNVIGKNDLPRLMAMFPKMKPLVDATATAPLLAESSVAQGSSGHGYVVMLYNFPQSIWEKRKEASVSVQFYHQETLTLALPK